MAMSHHRSMPRTLADPRALPAAKRSRRGKSHALWFRAALAGTLVIVPVVGTILVSGAKSDPNSLVDREVAALLAGIPQKGQTLGSPTAPVTLQVYAELEDYSSRSWFLRWLPEILHEFVRTDRLKIEYRSFKTNTIGSEMFVKQQAAALAAGEQSKLWNFAYTFYSEQGIERTPYVTESYLDKIARQVPALDVERWDIDRGANQRVEQVVEEDQQGRAQGIHVTPAYRIGRTGGPLKAFDGSGSIVYPGQVHATTYASAEDIAKAINQIR